MMEIVDSAPAIQVDRAEYQRLLGYPRDYVMTDRALELAEGAREWYRQCAELERLVRRVEPCRLETHPNFFNFFVDGCLFQPVETGQVAEVRHP